MGARRVPIFMCSGDSMTLPSSRHVGAPPLDVLSAAGALRGPLRGLDEDMLLDAKAQGRLVGPDDERAAAWDPWFGSSNSS